MEQIIKALLPVIHFQFSPVNNLLANLQRDVDHIVAFVSIFVPFLYFVPEQFQPGKEPGHGTSDRETKYPVHYNYYLKII